MFAIEHSQRRKQKRLMSFPNNKGSSLSVLPILYAHYDEEEIREPFPYFISLIYE